MDKLDKAVELSNYYRKTDTAGLRDKIEATIACNRRKKRRAVTISWAAAILLLPVLACGIWLIAGRDGGNGDGPIAAISPGDVTLTLSDGSVIALNGSTASGRIAQQHNVAVIRGEGELTYEKQTGDTDARMAAVFNTLYVPKGTRFDNLVLEDGTRVWLNAGSSLRYPAEFAAQGPRHVILEGEACFDVAADAARPFIVETAEQTLRVLGTQFNIYAYPDEPVTYTTLASGSVELSSKTGDATVRLSPGQQARLTACSGDYSVGEANAGEALAWRDGVFVFDGNSLELVFRKLSRWYDFEYSFDSDKTAGMLLMGQVPVYDDMERGLKLIESSGLVEIVRRGNTIRIQSLEE